MAKRSKKYRAAVENLEAEKFYTVDEAVDLLPKTTTTKFDASCEIHLNLGIDPKQADQIVRAAVTLPHGTGKKLKIVAFVPDDKVKEAKDAGADIAGGEDLINDIKKTNKTDFDIAVTIPEMMKSLH